MAKEKLSAKTEDVTIQETGKKKLTLEVDLPDVADTVVCQVCGHKNPKDTGMCVMCSNYLFD